MKTQNTALVSTGFGTRRSRAGPRSKEQDGDVHIVRSIFERWAKGDAPSDWADPHIEFYGPDQRGGRGIDRMVDLWNDWIKTVADFDVMPDQFLDEGDGVVLILARFVFCGKGSNWPSKVRFGVFRFMLSAGKVVRLDVWLINRNPLTSNASTERTSSTPSGHEPFS